MLITGLLCLTLIIRQAKLKLLAATRTTHTALLIMQMIHNTNYPRSKDKNESKKSDVYTRRIPYSEKTHSSITSNVQLLSYLSKPLLLRCRFSSPF